MQHPPFGRWRSPHQTAFIALIFLAIYFWLELQLFSIFAMIPSGIALPISTNSSSFPCYAANPFCELTCKGVFLDPFNFYIHKPIAIMLTETFQFQTVFSANFISVGSIIFGVLSARLITEDSLSLRRIGVLVYQVRNLLDEVDGKVAKSTRTKLSFVMDNETAAISQLQLDRGLVPTISNTMSASPPISTDFGYFLDGVCDGISCLFLITACFIHLRRTHYSRRNRSIISTPMTGVTVSQQQHVISSSSVLEECPNVNGYWTTWTLYGLQLFLSSVIWNWNILHYSHLLERSPDDSQTTLQLKSKAIRSIMTWLIIYLWRLLNPDTSLGILLFAIFFDALEEFFEIVKYVGYALILAAMMLSGMHYRFLDNLIYSH